MAIKGYIRIGTVVGQYTNMATTYSTDTLVGSVIEDEVVVNLTGPSTSISVWCESLSGPDSGTKIVGTADVEDGFILLQRLG